MDVAVSFAVAVRHIWDLPHLSDEAAADEMIRG